jgi:uncharacterized protein
VAVPEIVPPRGDPEAEIRWGMGDAVAGSVLTILAPVVVAVAVLALSGREDLDDLSLAGTALLTVPLWVGLAGAPWWSTRLKGRRSLAADFGLRVRWSDVPLGLVTGLVGQFTLLLLVQLVYQLLGVDDDQVGQAAEDLTDEADGIGGVVLLVLMVAVIAPALEELFYRGLWLRSLERRFGPVVAVVGSSVLFGAAHFQWYDFPALAGFGVLLGVLTVRTGRLGPAVCAHLAFNLTAVTVLLTT